MLLKTADRSANMYFLELNDILCLVKSLESPTPAFNVHEYVTLIYQQLDRDPLIN